MRDLPLVEVEWEDTTSDRRWETRDKVDVTPAIIQNIGWQLKHTRDYILLTSQRDITHNEYADRIRIPRGCIKSIKKVK